LTPQTRKLLEVFTSLPNGERDSVLAFAEFLAARAPTTEPPQLRPTPRPPVESVVGAIKRLSATYPMLDKAKLLNETSALMSQHILQGRAASAVIDELERTFLTHYQRLLDERKGEP
jgi:hypothetical protein